MHIKCSEQWGSDPQTHAAELTIHAAGWLASY